MPTTITSSSSTPTSKTTTPTLQENPDKDAYLEHFTDDSDSEDVNPNNYPDDMPTSKFFQRCFWDFGDHTTAAANNIPLVTWFDLPAGEILLQEDNTEVWFGINQLSMDWKYGLDIDYVALVPITMEDFNESQSKQNKPKNQTTQLTIDDDE